MPLFSDLDSQFGFPPGTMFRKASTKHPGDEFRHGGMRFQKLTDDTAEVIVRRPAAPANGGGDGDDADDQAREDALYARALADRYGKTHRWMRYELSTALVTVESVSGEVKLADVERLAARMRTDLLDTLVGLRRGKLIAAAAFDLMHQESIDQGQVAPVLWANDPWGLCWKRLSATNEPLTECPSALGEVLDRCSTREMRESLVLWVGSLMDVGSDRSQYLCLHGEGNDGKSSLFAALNTVFGSTYMLSSADAFRGAHETAGFEGKRLIVFSDENNTKFYSSGGFKALLGDDQMRVNPKGQKIRVVDINAKVIVATNYSPSLDGGKADKRRLLYVRLKSHEGGPDNTFKPRMIAEAGEMMRYCYTKWCEWKQSNPTGGLLGDREALEELLSDSPMEMAQESMDELFERKEGSFTPVRAVIKYLEHRVTDPLQRTKIRAALNSAYIRKAKKVGGHAIKVYIDLHLNDVQVNV